MSIGLLVDFFLISKDLDEGRLGSAGVAEASETSERETGLVESLSSVIVLRWYAPEEVVCAPPGRRSPKLQQGDWPNTETQLHCYI